jgi:hypothetical protein
MSNDGQLSFPVVRPPLRLNARKAADWRWAHYILGKAKGAALEADWKLRRWEEFYVTAVSCFTDRALPEEQEKFMLVVRERFEVTTYEPKHRDE